MPEFFTTHTKSFKVFIFGTNISLLKEILTIYKRNQKKKKNKHIYYSYLNTTMKSLESIFSNLAGTNSMFSYNWVFLVDFLVIIIAIIFYIYYINRLFAFAFTKLLNYFLFKRFHVIIDIEALHISLLFGTIQFKNLAVITKDSTVSIVQSTFQWKFWMLRSWLLSNN